MAKKAKKKRRTSKSSGSDVKSEMRRYKKGTAKSGRGGKGGKVKSKKQAIAIGLSKARKRQEGPQEKEVTGQYAGTPQSRVIRAVSTFPATRGARFPGTWLKTSGSFAGQARSHCEAPCRALHWKGWWHLHPDE